MAAEDLHHADLGRLLRRVFVTDQPERDHVRRGVDRPREALEDAVSLDDQRDVALLFADDELRPEAMLAKSTANGSGELTSLQRGDPREAVAFDVPRTLIGFYQELESRARQAVAGVSR